MLGLGAIGQFAIGEQGATGTPETITVDKWFVALSEPPRIRMGLLAAAQVAFFMQPSPVVSFSWFEALSEPARTLPRLNAAQVPFIGPIDTTPIPVSRMFWYAPLSEPARKRPQLPPSQNPAFVIDTTPVPISKINPWFMALSEPVRFRSGLAAARQQFLAAPSRLMPNPNITGTMHAVESGDLMTGGGRIWNRVVSGEVGAIEQSFTGAEVGAVVTAPSVGTSGVVSDVSVPASGSPVAAITTAKVSIIIV